MKRSFLKNVGLFLFSIIILSCQNEELSDVSIDQIEEKLNALDSEFGIRDFKNVIIGDTSISIDNITSLDQIETLENGFRNFYFAKSFENGDVYFFSKDEITSEEFTKFNPGISNTKAPADIMDIILYEHTNYRGKRWGHTFRFENRRKRSDGIRNLKGKFNDKTSSIKMTRGGSGKKLRMIMGFYEKANYKGKRVEYQLNDVEKIFNVRNIGKSLNDRVSSFGVRRG